MYTHKTRISKFSKVLMPIFFSSCAVLSEARFAEYMLVYKCSHYHTSLYFLVCTIFSWIMLHTVTVALQDSWPRQERFTRDFTCVFHSRLHKMPNIMNVGYLDSDFLGAAVDVYDSAVASTDDWLVLQDHNLRQIIVVVTEDLRLSINC